MFVKTAPCVVVCDIRELNKLYKNNTVDEIRAIDVLEHVSFMETEYILKSWYVLLKDNGKLLIQSPDLKSLARYILEAKSEAMIEKARNRVYGGQDYAFNYHYTALDETLMRKYLKNAGFTKEPSFEIGIGNGTNIRITIFK